MNKRKNLHALKHEYLNTLQEMRNVDLQKLLSLSDYNSLCLNQISTFHLF